MSLIPVPAMTPAKAPNADLQAVGLELPRSVRMTTLTGEWNSVDARPSEPSVNVPIDVPVTLPAYSFTILEF